MRSRGMLLYTPARRGRVAVRFLGRFGNSPPTTVLVDASLRKAALFGDWGTLRRKM